MLYRASGGRPASTEAQFFSIVAMRFVRWEARGAWECLKDFRRTGCRAMSR